MEQAYDLRKIVSSRKHIKEFARAFAAKNGTSAAAIEKDIIRAKKRNHISFGEYEWTGYHMRTEVQKNSISTLWTRAQFRKTYTDRRYISILMNKYIFSKVFSDFYGRNCLLTRDMNEARLCELAGESGKVVYKPACKGQGKGVRILPAGTAEERSAAMEFIRSEAQGIVEAYICQHDVLARLNPGAVSIVRFYSVCPPSGSYLFAPVLTTAISREISNGCQDALTAMIDIRTGTVITDAVDQNKMMEHAVHPITGVPFQGLRLPFWEETIEMMRRAVPLASKISNIGWDVALTGDGPIIVEANTIPGFNTAQYRGYSWITGGYGYQPLFDEVNGRPFADDGRYERVALKLD